MNQLNFDDMKGNVFGYCGFSRPLESGAKRIVAEEHLKYLYNKGLTIRTDVILLNSDIPYIVMDIGNLFDIFYEEVLQGKLRENTAYFFHDFAELAHCRQSSSRMNKIMTYNMVQLRKKGSYVIYNSRTFQELDKRVRRQSCAYDCTYGKEGIHLRRIDNGDIYCL